MAVESVSAEELNLMDDFLFQEVLVDREHGEFADRLLLSAIMGCHIGEECIVWEFT